MRNPLPRLDRRPSDSFHSDVSTVLAQGPATVEPMHVHHVHLNSLNPKAAAEYYLKPFPASTTKTNFNGYEAVKTGNVYLLFTKVNTPASDGADRASNLVWHFGWNTPDSRKIQRGVPCEGPENRSDVGRRRRQARRHVERYITRNCQRRSRSSKCEPRVRSRRGREALDISGARTAR